MWNHSKTESKKNERDGVKKTHMLHCDETLWRPISFSLFKNISESYKLQPYQTYMMEDL